VNQIADWGLRIAEPKWKVERVLEPSRDNPHSAIRNPRLPAGEQ